MDEKDLTVRELDEAKSLGLKPWDYVNITTKIRERYCRELTEKAATEVASKTKAEALQAAKDELLKQKPTAEQMGQAAELLKRFEGEALTLAEAASAYVLLARNRRQFNDRYRLTLLAFIAVFGVPTLLTLTIFGYTYLTLHFWAVAVGIATALIWTWVRWYNEEDWCRHRDMDCREHASHYNTLAEEARVSRCVTLPTVTANSGIKELIRTLQCQKAEYDRVFRPLSGDITLARKKAQEGMLAATDTQGIFDAIAELPR